MQRTIIRDNSKLLSPVINHSILSNAVLLHFNFRTRDWNGALQKPQKIDPPNWPLIIYQPIDLQPFINSLNSLTDSEGQY